MRRELKLSAVTLVVAMGAAACGSDGAVRPVAAKNVQLNANDRQRPLVRTFEGPSLLVDRDDHDTIYLGGVEMATGACKFYVSVNRGASWREESAPALEPFTRNCAMGIATSQNLRTELKQAPDGTIYYVFQANAPTLNGTRSVLVARSSDGGRSWKTAVLDGTTSAPEPGQQMEVNFEGHVAFDPANSKRIYAMWRRSFNRFDPRKPTRPFMSISEDGGATWAPPQLMFEKDNGFDGPRPVVVGNRLFAFWREAAPSAQAGQPAPVTRLFASVSTDRGRTWRDNEITNALDASEPVPLYDEDRKTFYVVWHDNRERELDAYFASSRDGVRWSAPKRLNDDTRGTMVGQHYPQISMSPSGRLDVAWYDWRDDPFPPPTPPTSPPGAVHGLFSDRGKVASVYMTSSDDGGRTWTKNVRVNDVPIDRTIGTWVNNADVMAPVAVASFPEGAVVAWSDTRNGNAQSQTQDIYTSTLTIEKAGERRVTPLQAGLVGTLLGLGLAMCVAVALTRRQRPPAASPPRSAREPEPVV